MLKTHPIILTNIIFWTWIDFPVSFQLNQSNYAYI
jgi:hypothetical protein